MTGRFILVVALFTLVIMVGNMLFVVLKQENATELEQQEVYATEPVPYEFEQRDLDRLVKTEVAKCQYSFVPAYCIDHPEVGYVWLVDNNMDRISLPLEEFYFLGDIEFPENQVGIPYYIVDTVYSPLR